MNNKTKYAIGAAVAVVAVVILTKSVMSAVLTVAVVGATVAGGYWAYKKYKDFKGKEYIAAVVRKTVSTPSATSNNSPSKNKSELSQEIQEERQFMFTNNKQKE